METSTIIGIILAIIVVVALIVIVVIILSKNKDKPDEASAGETFVKRKPSKEPYTVKEAKDINQKIDDYISQWIA